MATFNSDFDVAMIGGGPGGLAAALWCGDLGLTSVIIEREGLLGGQMRRIYNPVVNYPGIETANGTELADLMIAQAERRSGTEVLAGEALGIAESEHGVQIELSGGRNVCSRAVIIAAGVRRRKLQIPGEMDFLGRGILESGAKTGSGASGLSVAIIGGGDAAVENALILGRSAKEVFIVHRGRQFSARRELIDATGDLENVQVVFGAIATRILGDDQVRGLEIKDVNSNEIRQLAIDRLLIRIGVEPNSEPFVDIAKTPDGYLIADSVGRTNLSRVFAVGDIVNRTGPTIAGAVGQAATAVKAIYQQFVGE
ncbi:MAG: NAD(P)/FAD-dependent oxidoreductase [Pyrinomonadaceae bacterium]|nr:NAD(P)/FAD-dependent oxidoreductase [Pyrinomonadaceae bacterium]